MLWMYAIGGLLAGIVIGYCTAKFTGSNQKKEASAHKELQATKFELEQQRQDLIDHFAQSAEMLETLGKDYSKLYQHMAKTSAELLPNLPTQDNPFDKNVAHPTASAVDDMVNEPPKDYANGATGLFSDQSNGAVSTSDAALNKA